MLRSGTPAVGAGAAINEEPSMSSEAGTGRTVFAAALLSVGGILNIIWGIAAIDDAQFFANGTKFIISNLNTWGWVSLFLGVIELLAAASLIAGGGFGRWFAIIVACLAAIAALLTIPAYPLWSIAIFALSLWIISGLAQYDPEPASGPPSYGTAGTPR
jgi:hypothetical protein